MTWFAANPFPASAWADDVKDLARQKLEYLPVDWRTRISLAGPNLRDIEKECLDVLAATQDRHANESDIKHEAEDVYTAIDKVQQLIGPLVPQQSPPATAELLQATLWDAVPATFSFKEQFNRGRPHHCCDLPLNPMFQRPSPRYPGHPAYPSGHSTQVHLVAELYARMFPTLRSRLYQAAQGVARRREIAGLHFASDSAAGARLAVLLVDEFLKVPALLGLFNEAKFEWPHLTP